MPVVRESNIDSLVPKTAVEKIVGTDERNRRTKTYFPDTRQALLWTLLDWRRAVDQETLRRLNGGVSWREPGDCVEQMENIGQWGREDQGSVDARIMQFAFAGLQRRVESDKPKQSSIGGTEHD